MARKRIGRKAKGTEQQEASAAGAGTTETPDRPGTPEASRTTESPTPAAPAPSADKRDRADGEREEPQEPAGPPSGPTRKVRPATSAVWGQWDRQLRGMGGSNTLMRFSPTATSAINLTHANPSGLAQLMSGRRTRLSTLLRERSAYRQALHTAQALREKIFELATERGIDAGYLACGMVTLPAGGAPSGPGHADPSHHKPLTAPLLLLRMQLTARAGQDDYEVQVARSVLLNPALVRWAWREHRVDLTTAGLEEAAYSGFRMDLAAAFDRLRAALPGVDLAAENAYHLATFADLSAVEPAAVLDPGHTLLAALAQEPDAVKVFRSDQGFEPELSLDERDPAAEFLVADADPEQQRVVDAALAGRQVTVRTPPGTGATQTVANVVASLAAARKRVLVVGERRAELSDTVAALEHLGLGSLALNLQPGHDLNRQLVTAILRNERAEEPKVAGLQATLRNHRNRLKQHVESLHKVQPRWRHSPLDAMKSLAKLTRLDPPPATTVRLKRSVLDEITDRKALSEELQQAAQLGFFEEKTQKSAWFGAQLLNAEDADAAMVLAQRLASKDYPQLVQQMTALAKYSRIRIASTPRGWGQQLKVLLAVQDSLRIFRPEIFGRDLSDLIAATAPSTWRREEEIQIGLLARNRLKKEARQYFREGGSIPADLHGALVAVQEQGQVWRKFALDAELPKVHHNTAAIEASYRKVMEELDGLSKPLAATAQGGSLADMKYADLQARLHALASDEKVLRNLPESNLLVQRLRQRGLGELLDDFVGRSVRVENIEPELELAWWQSILEAMITGDTSLALLDGATLRQLEAEFRLADHAHIASGVGRLSWQLRQEWKRSLEYYPHQAKELRTMLKAQQATVERVWASSSDLVNHLCPVWMGAPADIAALPREVEFDVVVVLDAGRTALVPILPALRRTRQVVAFGDDTLTGPRDFSVVPTTERAAFGGDDDQRSVLAALDPLAVRLHLRTAYRSVDERLVEFMRRQNFYDDVHRIPHAEAALGRVQGYHVEYVEDGTGLPGPGEDAVESVSSEVNRVVDLVFAHAYSQGDQSLAVVTASAKHAERVSEAIRLQLPNHPQVAHFFQPHAESFVVLDVDRAFGLVRDSVIFSVGYGRTPHGRVLHHFGSLSSPEGIERFVLGLTRARRKLVLVSCFLAQDLDPARLSGGAKPFHDLLLFSQEKGLVRGAPETSAETDSGDGRKSAQRNSGLHGGFADDPLTGDLVLRLKGRGVRTETGVGGEIDIAAWSPAMEGEEWSDAAPEATRPLAIESDSSPKYRSMSVRERNRLRPQHLEGNGWRYMPLWSTEVFADPDLCANAIRDYLFGAVPSSRMPEEPASGQDSVVSVQVSPAREAPTGTGTSEPGAKSEGQEADAKEQDPVAQGQDRGR